MPVRNHCAGRRRASLAAAFIAAATAATVSACGAQTPQPEAAVPATAAASGGHHHREHEPKATYPPVASGLYGDPDAATRYWEPQTESDCGLLATRMVIGEITGAPPTEREIIDLAASTPSGCTPGQPVYDESIDPSDGGTGHGTCTDDLVLLLNHYGINADFTDDDEATDGGQATGIDALADYLGDGRQALVCVNAATIWDTDGGRTDCDHMVTVAAIDFDNDIVYLGDSGSDDTRGEQVSVDTFESAWATGDHELVVTR